MSFVVSDVIMWSVINCTFLWRDSSSSLPMALEQGVPPLPSPSDQLMSYHTWHAYPPPQKLTILKAFVSFIHDSAFDSANDPHSNPQNFKISSIQLMNSFHWKIQRFHLQFQHIRVNRLGDSYRCFDSIFKEFESLGYHFHPNFSTSDVCQSI